MVLAHLANLEPLFLARFKRMLHESEPTLSSLGPGQASPHSEAQPEELLAAYQAGRDDILLLLYAIKAEDWQRRAEHMTLGPTDLRHQVEVLIRHDQEHLGQLVDLRLAWERHSASVEMRPNEEADNAK